MALSYLVTGRNEGLPGSISKSYPVGDSWVLLWMGGS